MSVDERSRHQLYQRLQEVLGADEAGILMAHLPPGGVGQLATKDDLRGTEERLEHKIEVLRHEMDAWRHELRTEIHRTARTLTLSLTTIMAVLNGIVFAALKLA
jgi:hypothetical protein